MNNNPEIVQLSRWAEAAKRQNVSLGIAQFITEASKPRQNTLLEFQAMRLPGYRHQIKLPSSEFAADPDAAFASIPTEKCWFQVLPTSNDEGIKLTVVGNGKTHEEAKTIILEHISSKNAFDKSEVFLSEFMDNIYGGSIVVNSLGELYAEFGEGTQIDYSAGERKPTHFANKSLGRCVQYSFDDVRLRTATWNAIESIPHSDSEFFPGYYEFALVGENLRPLFLDYRSSPVFQF